MEVITIESQAFKEIQSKINLIAKFVTAIESKQAEQPEDGWVDSYEVCTFLKISDRTLQRLRKAGAISFSRIRGKNFYRISELQRLMQNNVIRRNDEHLQDLIKNHQLHVEQRRNIKADK
jgi:3-methyladenine DNA glycosylase Tag